MTQQDLLVTPIWFIILSVGAYLVRPYVTDENTRRYFMPALLARFVAAILLGVLYQFYYGGGDTFNFHTHGSSHIYDAFVESPLTGLNMLFSPAGQYVPGSYDYASRIFFFKDPSSYFVIKTAGFFDLITFNTYSATALFFALFSFSGAWMLYQVYYRMFSKRHFTLAIAILFIPSVVFWGSGILKDTLTMGALGWLVYSFYQYIIRRNLKIHWLIIFLVNALLLIEVKIYIFLTVLPSLMLWALFTRIGNIRSTVKRIVIAPVIFSASFVLIYISLDEIASRNPKYSFANIAETARITAYDIGFYTGKDAGSGYALGELDGTMNSMIRLFPEAVNVTLFRPYLWEVRNPLMVLSALEAVVLLLLTLFVIFRLFITGQYNALRHPVVFMGLCFSIVFAFAVGVSTFNFGTLARYKIPLIPFYVSSLVVMLEIINQKALKKQMRLPLQNKIQ